MKESFNVTTHPVGIGDIEKNVDIKTTNKSFGTLLIPDKKEGKFKIKPIRPFELSNVDFIKIDAEGYEPICS